MTNEGIAYFLPKRTIGGFSQYVVIEETMTEENQITEHPVQTGAVITDHIVLKPTTITIRAISGAKFGDPRETYQKLRDIRARRELMDIVTGKAAYRNMAIRRLYAQTDEFTENSLSFTVDLQEVQLVSLDVVSVPATEKQKNPKKTGAAAEKGKKQPGGEFGKDLEGPPDKITSRLHDMTGVTKATNPLAFLPR